MENFLRFTVTPQLPPRLEPLRQLASNLWFSWEPDAVALFVALDAEIWSRCYHNPIKLLQRVRQARLSALAEDDGYLRKLDHVYKRFQAYMSEKDTWFAKKYPKGMAGPIAYFSAEFGLHESVPEYSGGLGILS